MSEKPSGFVVKLDVFEGPFDLLLQLIGSRKMDVTEVALSAVTDEFIATVLRAGQEWDLDQTSSFLVVAATLLDLKAARLLPAGEVEDQEDLAVLEARDLLFSRLLQYRAFKKASYWLHDVLEIEQRRVVRPGGFDQEFRGILPEITLNISPQRFAAIAARALTPEPAQTIVLTHLHGGKVSVADQARLITSRLVRVQTLTFRDLCRDVDRLTTVARFLAILELFRQQLVAFEQLEPLGELTIRWTGNVGSDVDIKDEYEPQPVGDADE